MGGVSFASDGTTEKTATIFGKRMAYFDAGEGDPIVFLHGNPTSSYLWRNIVLYVSDLGRVIAPDLIGMGDSDKLDDIGPGSYRFFEHRRFLDALLDKIGVTAKETARVTLVLHDWGGALGFDWANRHRDAVKAVCYMETIVRPLSWGEFNQQARPVFEGFRSEQGEAMVLDKNLFVERVLPGSILRALEDDVMAIYRKPFKDPGEARRPTLSWPRDLQIGGEPADVVSLVQDYADWFSVNDLPKLFIDADPGAILIGLQREFCLNWKNQHVVQVSGSHFIQEDSPDEIGLALRNWLQEKLIEA